MSEQGIRFFVDTSEQSMKGARDSQDIGGSFDEPEVKPGIVYVDKRKLTEQISQLTGVIEEVFQQAESQVSAKISLEEIELTVEVNAEGQLGILGLGGKIGGKGGITLKFKRH